MNAAHLIDGHLPGIELGALESGAEIAHHEVSIQPLLLGETARADRGEARQESARHRQVVAYRLLGNVADLIGVAAIAENRSKLGIRSQRVLPLLVQQVVQRLAAPVEIRSRELLPAK